MRIRRETSKLLLVVFVLLGSYVYYANTNCSHISDREKSLAVILPLFWIQDLIGTSKGEDS